MPTWSGVDAFRKNWSEHNNWLCPPISMIGSVINYVALCKTRGMLLVPMWPSSYFWPLIYPNGLHRASFIRDFVVINPIYSSSSNSVFFSRAPFKALALSIDCITFVNLSMRNEAPFLPLMHFYLYIKNILIRHLCTTQSRL